MKKILSAIPIALCVSCAHQVQTTSHSSVSTVMARQVQNAADAGEGDLELRNLRARLAANPKDLDSRILLARLYMRRGLPDLALEHERLTVAQFPDSKIAALELAKTLRQMSALDEALKVAQDFSSRHGGSWELRSLEGILQDERGDFAHGEEAHRAALAVDPQQSSLHNNLGYNLLLQGHADAAAAEFRRAIELDPKSQIAHNNLGAAFIAQKAPAEALADWQKSSGPAAAHNNVAAVLMEQGRFAEARAELEEALKFKSDFPPAVANLKLVAEHDGKAGAVAPPTQVHFWKRVTSTLGWFTSSN